MVPYWSKGYATELGKEMIKVAFATTDIKGIYGMAQPENIASGKVLEKIGMEYLGNQIFRDHNDLWKNQLGELQSSDDYELMEENFNDFSKRK